MYQAQDTFSIELTGAPMVVRKGEVFSSGHAIVKHDLANGGLLFKVLEDDEPAAKPKKVTS